MNFEKQLSLFISLIFSFAIIIGGFYNYFLYNVQLDIEIFNFITTYDLIFTWISNKELIIDFLSVIFIFILLIYKDYLNQISIQIKTKTLYLAIFICIILGNYLLFCYSKDYNFSCLFGSKLFLLFMLILSVIIMIRYATKLILVYLFIIIIMLSHMFFSIKNTAFFIYDDLKFNLYMNSYNLELIQGNNVNNCKFNYQLIGTTTTHSIFLVTDISSFFIYNSTEANLGSILDHTENEKIIEIFNNSNISRMKYMNIDLIKDIGEKKSFDSEKLIKKINYLYKDCMHN